MSKRLTARVERRHDEFNRHADSNVMRNFDRKSPSGTAIGYKLRPCADVIVRLAAVSVTAPEATAENERQQRYPQTASQNFAKSGSKHFKTPEMDGCLQYSIQHA